jgi:tetratricopeptide (TPR) repeat protein
MLIFLSFLIPVFLIPKSINTQTFEHRLYLPMIGMLFVLSQTILLQNKLSDQQLLKLGAGVLLLFAVLNVMHQRHFKDEMSFWTQAVKTSPNSAYAIMMLGAKLPDPNEGAKLFRKAYAIDSTEKYINYYYGAMLQYQDSILESEKYLLAEKRRSDYVECDYMLARVAVQKGNIPAAIEYLENFLARAPLHELGNTNLLQLYIQSGDLVKARLQMASMDQKGLPVSPEIRQSLGG